MELEHAQLTGVVEINDAMRRKRQILTIAPWPSSASAKARDPKLTNGSVTRRNVSAGRI
jgi:hypothetical protein